VLAQAAPDKVLRELSLTEAKSIVADVGGRVDSVDAKGDEFLIEATLPGDMPVEFKGENCTGANAALLCQEYEFTIGFDAKSAEVAQQFDRERQVEFVADGTVGSSYLIWRMGFLYGGVTRTYIMNELLETADIGWSIAAIFPYRDPSLRPKGPKPADSGRLLP